MNRLLVTAVLAAALAGAWAQGPLPSVRPNARVDATALLRDLRALSADDMEGRQVGTPGGEKARVYVIARFKASGVLPAGDSYEQPFTFSGGRRSSQSDLHGVNVVGRIAGTREPGRYIVVSAHYDHLGTRNGVVYNGADDNASGTAALFALAAWFTAHRPANSLIFAAFDGEESGLRGSRAFVAQPPVDAASIVVDVNLDMIGRDSDDQLFAVGTRLNPFLKPYLDDVASKAPVKLLMGHDDPTQRGVEDWTSDSDHWAFQQAKIPAIYLGVEDFGQHHKATDDFETMTYDFYVRAVETSILVIEAFDAHLGAIASERAAGK
jgi:Zn-dependent M28 family amino/carboxypeptidase